MWTQPVGELIGSGGFASVWAIPSGVLKVAHADHDLARSRLAREAEALGTIGAPAVPRLDEHGVLGDGRAWIAMERITGASVADMTTAGPLRADRAVATTMAILDALIRVHAAHWVHRDLKPDNLVRRADGTVVVLDLGLVRKLPSDPDDPTRANVLVGSLEYMPPEQLIDAASVDGRADIYAVGCILYELCAGRPPFIGDAAALERAHAALRPPRLGALAAVPGVVEAICMDCLAKDPTKRPRDAADLRARLLATRDTPSIARSMPAISQISESKQPVVLIWVELAKVDRAVLAMLTARHVLVISQRGRRVFGALLGSVHADPATTAISLARDLAAAGARVAVHLDALRIEGQTLHGESVDKPETWLPTPAWSGVILTRALASVAQVPTRPADAAGPGFRTLGEATDASELFGRDGLLTDLTAEAAAALRGNPPPEHRSGSGTWRPTGPAFALLLGDPGVGKTVFAAELGRRIAELGARVHFATVPAPGAGTPPPLAGLIGTPTGPPVRAIGDALRTAARTRPTAVILDDLHFADHELLDALEYATLGGESLPLWVLGVAAPRLEQRRPQLGSGAERRRRDVLAPLDEDAAIRMTTALLRPAEYPPMRAVRQLVGLARNNPLHLTMLAREIHERGAIQQRPGGEFFLDTSALNELEPIALGPWIAARELTALAPELVALARVCAVLGDEILRDELNAVVEAVERSGGPTTLIDIDVGLRELTAAGILVETSRGSRFRQALVEEGIQATTGERERRTFHTAALAYWQRMDTEEPTIWDRIARHAEAVEDRRIAANAFAVLGRRAHAEHRALDAEQAWQGALRNLDVRDADRARALLGRACARYRLQRVRDALLDLDSVLELAIELADPVLEIEALLERATALDWLDDYAGSSEAAVRARARMETSDLQQFAVEVRLGEARSLWRAQKFDEAAPLLRSVQRDAAAAERPDTETIATLLLATVLVDLGELDAANEVFCELIPMCERRNDRFHLGAAHANRAWYWTARGDVDRCAEDSRRVIQLAREIGQAALERIGTYNLAESLLWHGGFDEALQLARRSLQLQRGHGEGALQWDQLLIARILAARGDLDELAELVPVLDAADLGPADRALVRVLRCVMQRASANEWTAALLAAHDLVTPDNRLELAHLALRAGALSADAHITYAELARNHPLWSRRGEL